MGEDQQQHIELCRDLAEGFNRTFKGKKPLFPLPQHVISKCQELPYYCAHINASFSIFVSGTFAEGSFVQDVQVIAGLELSHSSH